jgi:hypothetical protein
MASVDPQALLTMNLLYRERDAAIAELANLEAAILKLKQRAEIAERNLDQMVGLVTDLRQRLVDIALHADEEHTCFVDDGRPCAPCNVGHEAREAIAEMPDFVLT